jgi:hypothetical protein
LKVPLITGQYFPPEGRRTEGPYGKHYGNLFSKADFDRIAKASGASLKRAELFLSYLIDNYMNQTGLSSEKLSLGIPAAFARTARAVLLAKEGKGRAWTL